MNSFHLVLARSQRSFSARLGSTRRRGRGRDCHGRSVVFAVPSSDDFLRPKTPIHDTVRG